jgi:hypothetical protein
VPRTIRTHAGSGVPQPEPDASETPAVSSAPVASEHGAIRAARDPRSAVVVPETSLPLDGADGRASGASPLPADVTVALRAWLREQRQTHGSAATPAAAMRTEATRRAMRLVCEEAHRHGVRAEQVVVLLQHLWAALPADGRPDGRVASRELLEGIVRVCIEEFYADGPADGRSTRTSAADGIPHE